MMVNYQSKQRNTSERSNMVVRPCHMGGCHRSWQDLIAGPNNSESLIPQWCTPTIDNAAFMVGYDWKYIIEPEYGLNRWIQIYLKSQSYCLCYNHHPIIFTIIIYHKGNSHKHYIHYNILNKVLFKMIMILSCLLIK